MDGLNAGPEQIEDIAPNDKMLQVTNADELEKETIDKVIEDEITHKLSEDLLQSIEKKFQVDLER